MFSLRTLLLAVAVVAIGMVGLTTRNVWWSGAMSMLTLVLVATAIVGAIVGRGPARWFHTGFAAFGACYLFISLSLMFEPFMRTMLTTRVLGVAWRALEVPRPQTAGEKYRYSESKEYEDIEEYAGLGFLVFSEAGEMRQWTRQVRSFFIVGHCLWAMIFGFVGGLLACYLARETSRRRDPATPRRDGNAEAG